MKIKELIQDKLSDIRHNVFQISDQSLDVQQNKTGFEGDFTIVTFPIVKVLKKSPDTIAMELDDAFMTMSDFTESYDVVKGFLNLKIKTIFL